MVDDNDRQLPDVMIARVVERCDLGESHAEVSAWLIDLGYRVSPEDVAVIAARERQRQHSQDDAEGTGRTAGDGGPR